jgi:Cytochrome c554 and c-prime
MPSSRSLLKFFVLLSVVAVSYVLTTTDPTWSQSGEAQPEAPADQEPPAPADQQFIGVKQCASCHFEQFMKWKGTKHATTFDLLPAQYQTDAACLKCHTTGFGKPSGFTTAEASADLKGTTCEACHGPGSKHAEIAKQFANQKLTPEQEKTVRDSIWKVLPKNVCIECHVVQGHHDNPTPAELRKSK